MTENLEISEIKISSLNGDWIEYKDVISGSNGGSISIINFPKKPEIGEHYYVIQNGQWIKGIALKLR